MTLRTNLWTTVATPWACAACVLALSLPVHAQDSAPIQVFTPAGQRVSATLPWRLPPAARLQFDVQGQAKGFPFQTKAQLDWLPQGSRYEASQEVQIPVLGGRRQSSVGQITPQGLQPEVFMDRSRKEDSTTFDAAAGSIRFSRGGAAVPWVAGTQDRLSVFFQVAGMVAAAPQRYPEGTRITVQAASNRHVTPWTFRVLRTETLQLPVGTLPALKLQHLDADGSDGLDSALWLAPSLQYLPVRIRIVEDKHDHLDLLLRTRRQP